MSEEQQEQRTETVVKKNAPPEERDRRVSKAAQVVWFIVAVVVGFLLLRVLLALMGANLENQFASFIYSVTDPFVAPFRGLLQIGEFQAGVARLELETLVAVAVYALFGWLITAGIRLGKKY